MTVALSPVKIKAPGTGPSGLLTLIEPAIVDVSIGSENVINTELSTATSLALLAGFLEITVGGVVSGAALVVKVQTKLLAAGKAA